MCDCKIDTLSDDMILSLEMVMSMGKCSDVGFIGPNQKLKDIIQKDTDFLKSVGVTCENIADRIMLLREREIAARALMNLKGVKWVKIDKNLSFAWDELQTLGMQECPFYKHAKQMYTDGGSMFTIRNDITNEKIWLNTLHVHMIRNHYFFEGPRTPYRLDPEKTVNVLELNKNNTSDIYNNDKSIVIKKWNYSYSETFRFDSEIYDKLKVLEKFSVTKIKENGASIYLIINSFDFFSNKINDMTFSEACNYDKYELFGENKYPKSYNDFITNNNINADLNLVIISHGYKLPDTLFGIKFDKYTGNRNAKCIAQYQLNVKSYVKPYE
jgi:hypothetical protein